MGREGSANPPIRHLGCQDGASQARESHGECGSQAAAQADWGFVYAGPVSRRRGEEALADGDEGLGRSGQRPLDGLLKCMYLRPVRKTVAVWLAPGLGPHRSIYRSRRP